LQVEFKTGILRRIKFTFLLILAGLFFSTGFSATAQQVIIAPSNGDTFRIITIKQSLRLRQRNIDSATLVETVAGNVIIKEGLTTFFCDSAVINRKTNLVEAFGNIHINDNDSIHTYAQYLRYVGNDRIAYLKKNVKMVDKTGTLLTDELEYNLRTGTAT